jgi:lycopene cyclase domain-containing protein
MNEYTLAASAVLAAALILAGVRGLLRRRWVWIGLAVFAVLTILVDIVLTRVGVYAHRTAFNAGLSIDRMPLEDLLYGIALYLLAVLSWSWTPGKRHAR